jgi:hypothetical protein
VLDEEGPFTTAAANGAAIRRAQLAATRMLAARIARLDKS